MVEIRMHRGDLQEVDFEIVDGDGEEVGGIDEIFFTVKAIMSQSDLIMQKRLSSGEITKAEGLYHFTINPADTDNLGFNSYPFDIEIVGPGLKKTFLGKLTLEPEVTHAVNEGGSG